MLTPRVSEVGRAGHNLSARPIVRPVRPPVRPKRAK